MVGDKNEAVTHSPFSCEVGQMKKLILISIFFLSFSNKTVGDDLKILINSPLTYSGPSTECRTEICIELLALIDHANTSIDFAIYGLRGQPHILDALIDAEKRGVRVRGIIDKTVDGESYYKDTYLLEKRLTNIESDYQSDLQTSNDFKKKRKSENKKCERPIFTDGPLQCFEAGQRHVQLCTLCVRKGGEMMGNHQFDEVDGAILA